MTELELLKQLQIIENKMKNNQELTEQELKLFIGLTFSITWGIIEQTLETLDLLFNKDKGGTQ